MLEAGTRSLETARGLFSMSLHLGSLAAGAGAHEVSDVIADLGQTNLAVVR